MKNIMEQKPPSRSQRGNVFNSNGIVSPRVNYNQNYNARQAPSAYEN